RRTWSRCPVEVPPNVATRSGVPSTLCLIRSTFSDEKRGGKAPIFCGNYRASGGDTSPSRILRHLKILALKLSWTGGRSNVVRPDAGGGAWASAGRPGRAQPRNVW